MWTCPNCNRIFEKTKQPHSCKKVSLESHFVNKPKAKKLFDYLLLHIEQHIGPYKIISLSCCIHVFGTYDFLAALPKKDGIEIRISLNHIVDSPKLIASVPLSSTMFKNCFTITSKKEIDTEMILHGLKPVVSKRNQALLDHALAYLDTECMFSQSLH